MYITVRVGARAGDGGAEGSKGGGGGSGSGPVKVGGSDMCIYWQAPEVRNITILAQFIYFCTAYLLLSCKTHQF